MSRLRDGDGVDNRAGGKREGEGGNDQELAHDRDSIRWIQHIAKWHRRCDGDHAIAHLVGRDRWRPVAAAGAFSGIFAHAISGQYSSRG